VTEVKVRTVSFEMNYPNSSREIRSRYTMQQRGSSAAFKL
jgi:hypothetical protein